MGIRGILAVSGLLCFVINVQASQADCPQEWTEGTEYCEGEQAALDGSFYEAKWCTKESPTNGNEYNGWTDLGPCTPPEETPTPEPTADPTTDPSPCPTSCPAPDYPDGKKVVGYFVGWGVYAREYYVKNVLTSGSAEKLTHIVYAFGTVKTGFCELADESAEIGNPFTKDTSVDCAADETELKGNFNQLRKLKNMCPHLKIIWSFGGAHPDETAGFQAAAENAAAFADSCYDVVHNSTWDGLFDGIDIDWEYPSTAEGDSATAYSTLLSAVRTRFGDELVTSAITADGSEGGKMDLADYGTGAANLDFMMVMTYEFWGAWGPPYVTGAHAPMTPYDGMPGSQEMYAEKSIEKLRSKGVPDDKLLLGVPFYGHGWTGVASQGPGSPADGPTPGKEPGFEQGNQEYKYLTYCPPTDFVGGTAIAFCPPEWWTYDTPETTAAKATWAQEHGLGGVFFWELSGDTDDAVLLTAIAGSTKMASCADAERCAA